MYKRGLNRTQILSLPFPKSVSNINPAFVFPSLSFLLNFYPFGGAVPGTQNTQMLLFQKLYSTGQVFFEKWP